MARRPFKLIQWLGLLLCCVLPGCDSGSPWNDPHVDTTAPAKTLYTTFSSRPKTLDPAKAYSSDEYRIIGLIYEPPLQYQSGKNAYTLIPRTASKMPEVEYRDSNNQPLPASRANEAKYTVYTVTLKHGIYYQPHPAFAKDQQGKLLYHNLTATGTRNYQQLTEYPQQGTRELTADDYVYQIKRLADPQTACPVYGIMSEHIQGFEAFNRKLAKIRRQNPNQHIDLRRYSLQGVKALNRYQYRIILKGPYKQFKYWLAMLFFAPMPWEADQFYAQPGMDSRNLNLDWYPVGTGPYQLTVNNPNLRMVLAANPYYDRAGNTADNSKKPPFIQQITLSLEKENIPRWNKFLQGYYDQSSVTSDSFNQAIRIDRQGQPHLTPEMAQQGIQLQTAVEPSIFYFGFNMLDPVVGGYDDKSRKLRQAIALALDYSEYISIFLNGRAQPAHGPIPPGIFGYQPLKQGYDPTIYHRANGRIKRYSLARARQLLAEAGYPQGIDPETHKPLVLHYEAISTAGPGQKDVYDWLRQRFALLGIHLEVEATHYNRFQQKMANGNAQMFSWGWNADYPDPENFLFLFYGPNGKVKHGGENTVNYHNSRFDALFRRMRNMTDTQKRQKLISRMVSILHKDQPWVWGFYPKSFLLSHSWITTVPLNPLAQNSWQYLKVDPQTRRRKQQQWNQPVIWPLIGFAALVIAALIPLALRYWRTLRQAHGKED